LHDTNTMQSSHFAPARNSAALLPRYGPHTHLLDQLLAQAQDASLAQVLRVYHLYQQPDRWHLNVARRATQRAAYASGRDRAWVELDGAGQDALYKALPSGSLMLSVAWSGVADALRDALESLAVRDLIAPDQFELMYSSWGNVFDPQKTLAHAS